MDALLTGVLLVSLIGLGRMGLILVGLLKDPVLRASERYADEDDLYYPLPALLFWFGIFLFAGGLLLAAVTRVRYPMYVVGLFFMVLAYGAYTHPNLAMKYPKLLLSYPRWYSDLRERTTREERRRIAYMWLWLPRRVRLFYNSHDPAFNLWADMIILSTVMKTVDDPSIHERLPGGGY
jgi:hypothetical protein